MCDNNLKDNFQHLLSILEEKLTWFEKRQLETKRALKAYSRVQILSEGYMCYVIFEAEINHIITQAGITSILAINKLLEITKNNDLDVIERILFEYFNRNINSFLAMDKEEDILLLFNAVFILDENQQRKNLLKFSQKYKKEFLQEIFRKIAIYDNSYFIKTDEILGNYIDSELSTT